MSIRMGNLSLSPEKTRILIYILIFITVIVFSFYKLPAKILSFLGKNSQEIAMDKIDSFEDFKTDASKTSIDLKKILSGGPGKDGIPALINPDFVNVKDADVKDKTEGILVENGDQQKFYPFNILTWHEIVNDEIGGQKIAVTFCPLCGSSIVFDRMVDGVELTFKVSGYLYESNLLMYDTKTESFWSQALGKAVVGDYLDTKLEHVTAQRLTFSQAKKQNPSMLVLSKDTGHFRNYAFNPYSGYEDNEDLFFPIFVENKRFPTKERMYVVPLENKSLTFAIADLQEEKVYEKSVGKQKIRIIKINGEIIATETNNNNKQLPGYYEMWFSWATQHQENGVVWDLSLEVLPSGGEETNDIN